MAFLSSLDISGSGLRVQKLRMEVVSQNIANSNSVDSTTGEAYKRKTVVLSEKTENDTFPQRLDSSVKSIFSGVEVSEIAEDENAVTLEYDPDNPLANEDGYVEKAEINTVEEMVEMIQASRSYEANITVFNAVKDMATKALQLGK